MITNKIHTAMHLIRCNRRQLLISIAETLRFLFTNESFIRLRFRIMMGYKLNLESPRTFCEKIQWLKLYNHVDEYQLLVDKCAVKEIVEKKIGAQYIVPTYAQYEKFEEFNLDVLPESFVIKSNNGGGGAVIVCRDKRTIDMSKVKALFSDMHTIDIFRQYGEWAYKGMKPKVIVEKLLIEDGKPGKPLTDYKFFCFNGVPTYCQVIKGRDAQESIDFFDMKWNHLPFIGLNASAIHSPEPIAKPKCLEEMAEIAKKIAIGKPFVRIDLYEIDRKVYFGEITFYPASGIGCFSPAEYDKILGDKIILPNK